MNRQDERYVESLIEDAHAGEDSPEYIRIMRTALKQMTPYRIDEVVTEDGEVREYVPLEDMQDVYSWAMNNESAAKDLRRELAAQRASADLAHGLLSGFAIVISVSVLIWAAVVVTKWRWV
jgi:hypothetical protein